MSAASIPLPSFAAGLASSAPMSSPSEKTVRHASEKTRPLSVKNRHLSHERDDALTERVLGFLKQRHPYNTALCVAHETRLHRPTVSKWFERQSPPSTKAFARLIVVYGADFLAAVFGNELPWVTAAAWHERRSRFEAEQAAFEAEMGPALFGRDALGKGAP